MKKASQKEAFFVLELNLLMIFDFYENFSSLYPLKKDKLIFPDREKLGYYWDFEDYLVEDEKGKGLVLQGFMIRSAEDFISFKGIFDRAFLKIIIGSVIKNYGSDVDFVIDSEEFHKTLQRNTIQEIKKQFETRINSREEFFLDLESSLKSGSIWIATNNYWSSLVAIDVSKFWGKDVRIKTLPDIFSILKRKDAWEEVDLLGPLDFYPEMAWEDLSFYYPKLVKYIDEEIRQKSDLGFLDQCHDFGII